MHRAPEIKLPEMQAFARTTGRRDQPAVFGGVKD